MNSWIVTVEEDENGDLILPFPDELIQQQGWLEGDELEFEIEDRSIVIVNKSEQKRKESQS